ncbi:hypothetical protein N136_03217, partial [Leifsonia aquatica ATCC 14665]
MVAMMPVATVMTATLMAQPPLRFLAGVFFTTAEEPVEAEPPDDEDAAGFAGAAARAAVLVRCGAAA